MGTPSENRDLLSGKLYNSLRIIEHGPYRNDKNVDLPSDSTWWIFPCFFLQGGAPVR